MVYKAKAAKHDWRDHLTKDEAKVIAEYDALRVKARKELERLTPEFIRIRNRAMKRAEYKHRSKT